MIEFLRGRIASKEPARLVIDVGGVGLGVDVSLRTSEKVGVEGDPIELMTHMHVREEALELYGFHDGAEKALFLKLLSVSGIGPRLANILECPVGQFTEIFCRRWRSCLQQRGGIGAAG